MHWGGQNLKLPRVFKSTGNNKIKFKEKREFLPKIGFGFWRNSKTNDRSDT